MRTLLEFTVAEDIATRNEKFHEAHYAKVVDAF
jgi:hypothetical protein